MNMEFVAGAALPAGTSGRVSRAVAEAQGRNIAEVPLLGPILDAVRDILAVVNAERQIVFANRSLLNFLGLQDASQVCGLRLGEALNCVHAFETPGGCGTTETCQTCGAFLAIRAAQSGQAAVEECRILRRTHDALELRVSSTPLETAGEPLAVVAAHDISHEKRRRAFERIFFHDVLNTAGALWGFATLLQDACPDQMPDLKEGVYYLSKRIIDEVQAQRELAAAESAELEPHPDEFDALELVRETLTFYAHHEVACRRCLELDPDAHAVTMYSDRLLLGRVIGNMVKNAL